MEDKSFTQRILSLTLEVIHLLTGEDYVVVKKSGESLKSSRPRGPAADPPPPSLVPEAKNVKKILQVANNIIHLLTGEVLGCLEDQEDLEDVMIYEGQPSASLEIPNSRNNPEGLHVQIAPHVQKERKGVSRSRRKSPESELSQQKVFSLDQGQLSPCSPELCDIGTGASADDRDGLEFTMIQIKEELELWEGLEEDQADTSTPPGLSRCQSSENGATGVDGANANNRPLSDTGVEGFIGQSSSQSSTSIPNAKTYKCPECPEVFGCRSELFKHQSHHRGSPLFSCSLCGKNFTSKSNLAKHQKIHTGEKPFSCPECGKRFREKHYLASHQAIHRGAELIACPQCGKGYTSKSNLAKHQRIHTGQKPFGCSICGKSFNQRSVLIAHQRTHTGEKPFSCDSCPRRFTDKLQLARHQATHAEGKSFCCNECRKSFGRKDLLLKHLATHSMDGSPD